ncbi:MAG: ORF6N domain-containing protein [Candidatus Margulisiibacteriota bacterium]|jgi:hypothetical protein
MGNEHSLIAPDTIENNILIIRGKKVMLDKDLAILYEVPTKILNQAVKRNSLRFPEDFMFQLTRAEMSNLKSQFVTSSWGGVRKLPLAFTEQGIAMLSGILNSQRAILVNIQIMRVFVKLRQLLQTHKDILDKINELETRSKEHDYQISVLFENIRLILNPPEEGKKKPIGFGR